jgi:YjbE family integral membrane protein
LILDLWPHLLAAAQIIWINVILSGDNAVVIALACRNLPPKQRKWGMILGAGAAVLLRIFFTLIVVQLLATPFLKLVGGALLLWIAVKLIGEDEEDAREDSIKASDRLTRAVWTVTVADAVMSLDNVLAIAGIAQNNQAMLIFGLAVSIPLIVAGAGLIVTLLDRFPILVWAGAGLLGWVAAEMIVTDMILLQWLQANYPSWLKAVPPEVNAFGYVPIGLIKYSAATAGVLFVLAAGYWLKRSRGETLVEEGHPEQEPR